MDNQAQVVSDQKYQLQEHCYHPRKAGLNPAQHVHLAEKTMRLQAVLL